MVEAVGPARFRGALHDLGTSPAFATGHHELVGDLCRVTDERLASILDPFERYDPANPAASRYVRERIRLIDPAVDAWIYRFVAQPPPGPLVASGDWVSHLSRSGRDGTLGPTAGA